MYFPDDPGSYRFSRKGRKYRRRGWMFSEKTAETTLFAGIVRNRPEFYDNESGFAVPDAFAGFIGALPG